MNVLISGGCKNGKTGFAEQISSALAGNRKKYYVATMIPFDEEDRERIRRHLEERKDKGFETLEIPTGIDACVEKGGRDATYLIDSTTALLLNEFYRDGDYEKADLEAEQRCIDSLLRVAGTSGDAVYVTDYIYSDALIYEGFTERYRKSLAAIDRALARVCDTVIELCAGNMIFYKGGLPK